MPTASRRSCPKPPSPARRASSTLEELTEALALWPGAALEGFEHEEWARPDAVRLDELRAQAVDDRAEAELDLGLHEAAVSGPAGVEPGRCGTGRAAS